MALLRDSGGFMLCLLMSVFIYGQQNPFDVYRTSNPNPQSKNLSDYRIPQVKTLELESDAYHEPVRIAAVTPLEKDSLEAGLTSPFDVYSRSDDPLKPIPNPLKARNVDLPEKRIEYDSTPIPLTNLDKSSGDLIINPDIDQSTPIDLENKGALNNPFDVADKSTSIPEQSQSESKDNSPDQYDIQSVENRAAPEVESSLPKDQKVKGYFNSLLTNYVFWILLGFLVLLTFIVNINRKLIPEISKSLISDNYLRITYREYNKGFTQFLSYLLYLNFFAQAGLFAFLAQKPLFGDFTWPWYYFIGGAFGVYMVRHIVLWILGSFFPVHRETSQFSFVIMQFNLFIGLILFGLNWLLAFGMTELSKPLIFIGLSAVVLLYLIRQFRGLLLSARIVSHYKFHFFLYLCAVEFAPILMLYKVVAESFS